MSQLNEKPTPEEVEIAALIIKLKSNNSEESRKAYFKLIESQEQAVPSLISVLDDNNNNVISRLFAANALVEIGDVRAVDVFMREIESPQDLERDWLIIISCVWGLAKIRNDAIADFLFRMLTRYREHLHGLSAFSGALKMQGERAKQIVIAAATQNEDKAAKWAAFYHIHLIIINCDNISQVDQEFLILVFDETNNEIGKDRAIALTTAYLEQLNN